MSPTKNQDLNNQNLGQQFATQILTETSSENLFEAATSCFPGGVHSPVRSFKGLGMAPRFFKSANGAMIEDVSGKDYIDFCMSFGPLIHGHRAPFVEKAIVEATQDGWSYGACEPYSLELAHVIKKAVPWIESLRFVNSGTEAIMTAVRLARGATGRTKILKFNGCYHGHLDSMLIKSGSGLAGTAEASSDGVPTGVAQDTLIAELDDEIKLEEIFKTHGQEIAAVFIEPLPANYGLLEQRIEFLQKLESLARDNGSLLVFDEVISGFRVALGGMAEVTGITPDLVGYGKIIGGGLPVGCVAGKREFLNTLAPVGSVYQAGTLSANPLAMRAGVANLSPLLDNPYPKIEETTHEICKLFDHFFQTYQGGKYSDTRIVQHKGLFWFACGSELAADHCYRTPLQFSSSMAEKFKPLFLELLEKGIYLAPNAYEVGFTSLAHANGEVLKEIEKRLWD